MSSDDQKGGRRPDRLVIRFDDEPSLQAIDADVLLRSAALVYKGTRIPIPKRGLTIGGTETADIQLDEAEVASEHARIETTECGHAIVDQGSSFGTYVNGDRLGRNERRPLERGDTISIARQLLHYVPSGERMRRLAPIAPVDAGRVRSAHDRFTIGRSEDCDLVLDHPTVSAHQAVIRMAGGKTWIEDLTSASGVRVNGISLRRTSLEVGDQIAIGPFRIVFDGEDLIERSAAKGLAVTALGITVVAGGRTILQPTNLQIRPGELVAIIGESGAGKSTLLKVLAGVIRPSSGGVLAGGEPLETRLTEIGYVPQFDIVHGQLTIREALDYAAQLRLPFDLGTLERSARVKQTLERLQLSDRADVLLDLVSGGQRKRAAVGTELLHQPGALFLDEPTTGLDPGLERRLMELFRELATNGQTVALATHATASIALCDRVVAIARGGIVRYDGKPAGLLESFRVASYDDVYTSLTEPSHTGSQIPRPPSDTPLPPISRGPRRPTSQPTSYQARVLASRYTTLLRRDKRHLRSALIQVPILSLLAAFLFTHGVFNKPGSGSVLYTGRSAQLLFLMVIVTLWLGSINAAREIVKERHIIHRELAVGVQIPAYIVSKLLVLLTFSGVQTALFSLIVITIQPLHESLAAALTLIIVLILTSWIGVIMGLVVSALASSQDHATGVIPLLLVPQLLLGGAIVTLKDMSAPIHILADLIPARWGFAAAGHSIHLQQRISMDQTFSTVSSYGTSFFALPLIAFAAIAAVFASVLLVVLTHLLRRSKSEPID